MEVVKWTKFPSPYGVSFILIEEVFNGGMLCAVYKVSVSLRSIIHSYSINFFLYIKYYTKIAFPSPYGVSFILMSTVIKIQVYIL